jgi:xanthine dehydrogenase small subunit
LQLLREDLGATAAKEGCNEGDCGACTVVLGQAQGQRLRYTAVNSCIRLAHSVAGCVLWTAQDLPKPATGPLHPVQQALVDHHASQCGFCTPGFVSSLFALYQQSAANGQTIGREQALHALSGNLCRCTGYRPIVQAAQHMQALPPVTVDEPKLLQLLEHIAQQNKGLEANLSYEMPQTLGALLSLRQKYPQAQIVAGCTDVGLWVTKQHRVLERVIDVTRVTELRQIQQHGGGLRIGATVSLTDAFEALAQSRPALRPYLERFAGMPVRNAGTLGGNLANGSPIGDGMPLLIALGARITLASVRGQRSLALEDFYLGYRQTDLQPDEVLAWIDVPPPAAGQHVRAYKVSKRLEDDISAVSLVLAVQVEAGHISHARIGAGGAGGVAATPARARQTEAALVDKPWDFETFMAIAPVLQAEFAPISDIRASAAYRREVLGSLLIRFWHELNSPTDLALADLCPVAVAGEPS